MCRVLQHWPCLRILFEETHKTYRASSAKTSPPGRGQENLTHEPEQLPPQHQAMAPGSRSRTPSLRRQSQPVYPLPMIIEDVVVVAVGGNGGGGGADTPILPERSPRRARPASVPVLPSQYSSSGLSRNSSSSSIRAASERGLSSSSYTYKNVGDSGGFDATIKSEAPRRHDPERHRIMDRMARRGGWYKLILLSILLVGSIIGLGVGLTLGLRKRYQCFLFT